MLLQMSLRHLSLRKKIDEEKPNLTFASLCCGLNEIRVSTLFALQYEDHLTK